MAQNRKKSSKSAKKQRSITKTPSLSKKSPRKGHGKSKSQAEITATALRKLTVARGQRMLERWRKAIRAEIANGITHGIGAGMSIAGLVVLIVKSSQTDRALAIVSFTIYGTTLVLLYLASTLYHSLPNPRARRIFRILDHSAIYLVIAGTYTPFTLITIRGPWGYSLFGVIWGLALAGVVFKAFFVGRWDLISTIVYIVMGWLAVIAWSPLQAALPTGGIALIVAGGLSYTIGTIFYAWHRLPYHHAIWHLFVLGGSILHYLAVLLYVTPTPA